MVPNTLYFPGIKLPEARASSEAPQKVACRLFLSQLYGMASRGYPSFERDDDHEGNAHALRGPGGDGSHRRHRHRPGPSPSIMAAAPPSIESSLQTGILQASRDELVHQLTAGRG